MPINDCTRNCWIAAAILGLLIWIFTAGFGPLGWFAGLFLGLIGAGLSGVLLVWLGCSGAAAMGADAWQPDEPAAAANPDPQPRGVASDAAAGILGAADEDQADQAVAPSGDAQAPSGNGKRGGSDRTDIYGGKSASSGADETAKESEKPAKEKPAKEKPAKEEPAKKLAAPAAKAEGDEGKDAASDAEGDDLKQIKGVGPKIEEILHENGITRFTQIAEWDDEKIDHFAEVIGRMGGRIRSDDWVDQAPILAEGGDTEFSKRVEKGDVY